MDTRDQKRFAEQPASLPQTEEARAHSVAVLEAGYDGLLESEASTEEAILAGDVEEPPRRRWHRDVLLGPMAALVFFLDQFTKAIVRESIGLGQSVPTEGFFRFTHAINTGSAFGLFPDQTLFLIGASVVGISVLVFFYRHQRRPSLLLRLSLGLELGGALSNLTDRVTLGYVVDFIDVGPWPIFNLADSSIVVGIFLLLWVIGGNGQKQTQPPPETSSVDDQ